MDSRHYERIHRLERRKNAATNRLKAAGKNHRWFYYPAFALAAFSVVYFSFHIFMAKRCRVSRETARVAALLFSVILIFTSVTGIIYPAIQGRGGISMSMVDSDAASGEAADFSVSPDEDVIEAVSQDHEGGDDADGDPGSDGQSESGEGNADGISDGLSDGDITDGEQVDGVNSGDSDSESGETEPGDIFFVDPESGEDTGRFYQKKIIDGIEVFVTADAGVFPEGCTLDVSRLQKSDQKKAIEAVDEVRESDRKVENRFVLDIRVLDPEGNEVQPDTDKGQVKVAFATSGVEDECLTKDIYHIRDISDTGDSGDGLPDGTGESTDAEPDLRGVIDYEHVTDDGLFAEQLETKTGEVEETEVAFAKTDGFSTYVLELTYGVASITIPVEAKEYDLLELMKRFDSTISAVYNCGIAQAYPEYFEIYNSGGAWKLKVKPAITSADKSQTYNFYVHVNSSSNHVVVTVKFKESADYDGDVLIWRFGDPSYYAPGVSQRPEIPGLVKGYFEKAGRKVVYTEADAIAAEMVEHVSLVYLIDLERNHTDKSDLLATDENAAVLRSFVNRGGRVVLQGELGGFNAAGNASMKDLAHKLGANFTITDAAISRGGKAVLNKQCDLTAGIDELGGLNFFAVGDIVCEDDTSAIWVAKYDFDGTTYHFIVDQKAGKGRITALCEFNFFWTQEERNREAVWKFFDNLYLDAVENIKKVTANPKMDMHSATINPSESDGYYRILDSSFQPVTGLTAHNDVSDTYLKWNDGSAESDVSTINGWVKGTGGNITFEELDDNTMYVVESISEGSFIKYYVGTDPIPAAGTEDFDRVFSRGKALTFVDPTNPRNESGAEVKVLVERESSGIDPDKDIIRITNIKDKNLQYALKYQAGRMLTDYKPVTDESGKTTGMVVFGLDEDDVTIPGDSQLYLVARDPVLRENPVTHEMISNDKSGELSIPCCELMNEWHWTGEEQEAKDSEDYLYKSNGKTLMCGRDYETIDGDSTYKATDVGYYSVKIAYKDTGDYADSGTLIKTWQIRKVTLPNVEKNEYVSIYGAKSRTIDLNNYIMPEGRLGEPVKGGDLADSITQAVVNGTSLTYSIAPHELGVNGEVTIPVTGCTHYNDYQIKVVFTTVDVEVPEPAPAGNSGGGGGGSGFTQIVTVYETASPMPTMTPVPVPTPITITMTDEKNIQANVSLNSASVRFARVRGLKDYAASLPGKNIQVDMQITEKKSEDIAGDVRKNFNKLLRVIYGNGEIVNIGKRYFDITVTKSIDGGEPEVVPDLGRAVEIELVDDEWIDGEPVTLRQHEDETLAMSMVDERPESNYEDGEFYDGGDGTVYIYGRFFSTYSVAYLNRTEDENYVPSHTPRPQPEPEDENTVTTVYAHQPETGDHMRLLFVWIVMLASGIVLMGYGLGFIKRKKKQ
ncbi:MAG: hypothetical protein J5819_10235 [Eubacterium sp.]|nr:hypothetical protein [Eubacterium sp.]